MRRESRPDQVTSYPFATKGIATDVKVVDETANRSYETSLIQELATLNNLEHSRF